MAHCPYCGTPVKENELYCVKCGKELPYDLYERADTNKHSNRLWLLPISMAILFLVFSSIYYFMMQSFNVQAKKLYAQGEEQVANEDFQAARGLFQKAIDHKENFEQAKTARHFAEIATENEAHMEEADKLLEEANYTEALDEMKNAERDLNSYNGEAVSKLIDKIEAKRSTIKTEQLQNELDEDPSIDDLKTLIWEAESINNDQADEITEDIREQIINDTYAKASDQLNANQFSDAKTRVDDGLKYAPDSDRLDSLETTIEKEKEAFETEQEKRIDQAMDTAEEEEELNETDAVEVTSASVDEDGDDELEVSGKVESVATVPVNSISIEYELVTEDDEEILTNDVYVYPDTLYPDEKGKFEYTHDDVDEEDNVEVNVKKIKWYTD